MTKSKITGRRERALERLKKQLANGTTKVDGSGVALTDGDKKRINREIGILESKV